MLEVGTAGRVRLPVLLAIGTAGIALAIHVRREHRRTGGAPDPSTSATAEAQMAARQ
jgi:hypothetical protein